MVTSEPSERCGAPEECHRTGDVVTDGASGRATAPDRQAVRKEDLELPSSPAPSPFVSTPIG